MVQDIEYNQTFKISSRVQPGGRHWLSTGDRRIANAWGLHAGGSFEYFFSRVDSGLVGDGAVEPRDREARPRTAIRRAWRVEGRKAPISARVCASISRDSGVDGMRLQMLKTLLTLLLVSAVAVSPLRQRHKVQSDDSLMARSSV